MTPCDQCTRGILPGPWPPKPCTVCGGAGILTVGRLAKLFEMDERTVKGIWTGKQKTRVKTAQRVLARISQLTGKSKQGRLL